MTPLEHLGQPHAQNLVSVHFLDRHTLINDLAPTPAAGVSPEMDCSVVVLPAPLAPDQGHDLALVHLQVDALHHMDISVIIMKIFTSSSAPILFVTSQICLDHFRIRLNLEVVPSASSLP